MAAACAYRGVRADPACDDAGRGAATQCVQDHAGTASPSEIQVICVKAGHDARDKCERDKQRARLTELQLTKCDETFCYLVGVKAGEEVVCGRMKKSDMTVENGRWTNLRDAELAKYDACPKPVKDDYREGKRGPQPPFRSVAAAPQTPVPGTPGWTSPSRSETMSELDQILEPFSRPLGPPPDAPPPNRRRVTIGAPPRTATGGGSSRPSAGGTSSRQNSTITGTECIDACTGAGADADSCARCRAGGSSQQAAAPPPMPQCAKSDGNICGSEQTPAGLKTHWCCSPYSCTSTLGQCSPPPR